MAQENILSVKNLSVSYGEKKIIHDVNFSVRRGEILVIAGESGSGKSTILKAIDGLLGVGGRVVGEITFDGKNITHLDGEARRKISGASIAMIFQNAGASFCPIRTIGAQIFESVEAHKDWTRENFLERAKKILKELNLDENILDEYPFKLSGGMAQRAGILAAMILDPKLILADEPTSALDVLTQSGVVKELLRIRADYGVSIVMVTHQLGIARRMADKVLIMRRGLPVEFGTKEEIFTAPKENYTRQLIQLSEMS